MIEFPLIQPRPPRLSTLGEGLRGIEDRQIYSNGGPVVRQFERDVTDRLFGGRGETLAVANATVGLMLALRYGIGARANRGHFALVPALTFAATAQAAVWAGLVPLIHDIDPDNWASDPAVEEALLRRHDGRIAALVPYAPFGRSLDLDRYAWLARRHAVTVVIDAAASLGSQTPDGLNFGAGAPLAMVYSMHATKPFATTEGGLVHSGNADLIAALRRMSNFGFGASRSAELPGFNAKLSEVAGLLAAARLTDFDGISAHRAALGAAYRAALPDWTAQAPDAGRQCYQFWSLLLPPALAPRRAEVIAGLAAKGVGAGHYFSPHLGEQPYFRATAQIEPTPVADAVARRIVSLPISDTMTVADVGTIAERLRRAVATLRVAAVPVAPRAKVQALVVIGGGPAGTALLTAAARSNRLAALARDGLTVVERGGALGAGGIGHYAIRSDTTAQTFLSALDRHDEPPLRALADHPAAHAMAQHVGALGAPLTDAGHLLAATGQALGAAVTGHGGTVLTGHEVIAARRTTTGQWSITVKPQDGRAYTLLSRHIVIATGGQMRDDLVAAAQVAGARLGDLAGDRLMTADAVMRIGGREAVVERLAGLRAPRIVIVGGSTSALATAVHLLNAVPGLPLGAGAVTVMHRRPLRPFYASRAEALADGFSDFTEADVCPVSGFVYRLAGFRLESRELLLRALAIGGRVPDPRLALFRLDQHAAEAARAGIAQADLVIGATGYRPRALPLFDMTGAPIALACDGDAPGPMVDRHCRVLGADGSAVAGVFGLGLAAGFVPWGPLGGEPSFRGNANGLWLWQNDVGQMIVDQVLGLAQQAVA